MDSFDAFASLDAIRRALDTGALTSQALVQGRLDRIARFDPVLHAYVDVYAEAAMLAAEAADRLRRAGIVLGPLHGVTVAVKDLFDIAGRHVTAGSRAHPPRMSDTTATVVERLQQAGAIVLGKTHTVEFAFGGWGTNASAGTPRNPWDMHVHRVPGGSSSGSAVAVAAGLACAAIGSDTGGSVRIPAGLCGLAGLKTTHGLISRHGLLPLSPTHDTVGPLTRTVTDAALVLDVIAGPDPRDPSSRHAPVRSVMSSIGAGVRDLRVCAMPDEEREGVEPAVLAAYDGALDVLQSRGARLVRRAFPRTCGEYMRMAGRLMAAEGYANLRAICDREDLAVDPHVRQRVLSGRDVSAVEYIELLGARERARHDMLRAMDGVDVCLLPTNPLSAIPVAQVDEASTPLARFNRMANLLDMCSVAVPAGFSAEGLPVSVQFMGRGWDEPLILRAALAYEQATRWYERTPAGLA
jgi:aspartyl-tRNA(Asn)/glutamyl-tRNA(Gln) amidotransferase subunit A